jgi:uncharacterized protein YbjT (DUF2867 family)
MKVAMIGATGLVGGLAAPRLLAGGWTVEALVRRPSGLARAGLNEHVAQAGQWPSLIASMEVEAAVSALGTTMRQAGSQAAFRAVDHDMVVHFASAASAAGARRMVAVSSVGADPGSANFYLRTKGEMERGVEAIGFDRLDIRLGERVGIALSPIANLFLRGSLDRFAAIDADVVAAAIAACLGKSERGTFRHENRDLRRLAAP